MITCSRTSARRLPSAAGAAAPRDDFVGAGPEPLSAPVAARGPARCFAAIETYTAGNNGEAVEALRRLADGASRVPVWIYGATGSGKSHLLQAACALRQASQGRQPPTCRSPSCGATVPRSSKDSSNSSLSPSMTWMRSRATTRGNSGYSNSSTDSQSMAGGLPARPCGRPRRRVFACLTLPHGFPLRRCIAWSLSRNLCRLRHSCSVPSVVASCSTRPASSTR